MPILYLDLHERFLNFLCYFQEVRNRGNFYFTRYDLTIKLSSISDLADIHRT